MCLKVMIFYFLKVHCSALLFHSYYNYNIKYKYINKVKKKKVKWHTAKYSDPYSEFVLCI